MSNGFSDFLVFVDESGDHGLARIDPNYPVFVLAFCVMRKADYSGSIVPALQAFKFRHFGHDNVILHERDIRKDIGAFAFLKSRDKKAAFIEELTGIVDAAPFTLICTVIRKVQLKKRYTFPDNPYHVALGFGLERVYALLRAQGAGSGRTHITVERRGTQEDAALELEFRRICDGANYQREQLPLEVVFVEQEGQLTGAATGRPCGTSRRHEHTAA